MDNSPVQFLNCKPDVERYVIFAKIHVITAEHKTTLVNPTM